MHSSLDIVLRHAAAEYCREHRLAGDHTHRLITDAFMHGALNAIRYHGERLTADAVILNEVAEAATWQEVAKSQIAIPQAEVQP